MTKVKILRDNKGSISIYEISGHTGYSPSGGDIVCAAVSILGQTTLLALNEVCGIDEKTLKFQIKEEEGYLKVTIPGNLPLENKQKADIVLETMFIGIRNVSENYSDYITLECGEV